MLICIIMYPFLDEKTEAQRGQVISLKSQSDGNRTELNPRLPDSRDCSHNRSAILLLNNPSHHQSIRYSEAIFSRTSFGQHTWALCISPGIQTPTNLRCLELQSDLGHPR